MFTSTGMTCSSTTVIGPRTELRGKSMDTSAVAANLAGLAPLSVLAWFLVLPRKGESRLSRIGWWPLAAVVIVPLGGFLAAAVGLAFDEPLRLAPFSWIDRPLFAIKVITACAVVGAGWSYGMACLLAKVLHRHGWTIIPPNLLGSTSKSTQVSN